MLRDNEYISVPSMRDNVLFEIGLCSMALGLSRVILLTDSKVHMPDDLVGLNGQLALKHITLPNEKQYSDILNAMGGNVQKTNEYFNKVN